MVHSFHDSGLSSHCCTNPLVDFILEVRDARIPLSSACQLLTNLPKSPREDGKRRMEREGFDIATRLSIVSQPCYLNFLQAQIKGLKNIDHSFSTITMMMVGIPNVEKRKLKRAKVSPYPGDTKDVSSLKIGSHPTIYVLDTPSILPPQIFDAEVCFKLALIGAISDCLIGEKKWEKLSSLENDRSCIDHKGECSSSIQQEMKGERQNFIDHTQDFIVHSVRRMPFGTISCFDGDMQNEVDLQKLIELQLTALREAFHLHLELGDDVRE
uniref:G domain-containing protein n=1 Tax=Manihot esculenta TaxID=3983 RepID=A0A2C9V195_MANES